MNKIKRIIKNPDNLTAIIKGEENLSREITFKPAFMAISMHRIPK